MLIRFSLLIDNNMVSEIQSNVGVCSSSGLETRCQLVTKRKCEFGEYQELKKKRGENRCLSMQRYGGYMLSRQSKDNGFRM